jgi:DNA-binding LacI/PurR family transcriptional regulator/DNA-binding transcriptional regulator YhcF (GntR family)
MKSFRTKSTAEQLADFLKEQILRGFWQNHMPGAPTVAKSLEVDHRMVISAFEILEKEGLLVSGGVGKRRRITVKEDQTRPVMKFQILCYEETDRKLFYLLDLQHKLMDAGHICSFSSISLTGLKMDLAKLKRHVEKNKADAWIIFAGSREILEWFSQQETPAFALAGRMNGIRIPGCRPNKVVVLKIVARRLIELGHRRIVLMVREERRKPKPAMLEREFLEILETHGIKTGAYNLPDWSDNIEDFHRCLSSLLKHTPPTAIILDESQYFTAAQLHLAYKGIIAPRDVSLVCTDPNPAFNWCQPAASHIDWDSDALVRRILRWADHVARGQEDFKQDLTSASFVEGGTIGPLPVV